MSPPFQANQTEIQKTMMKRCFFLAQQAKNTTAPNPRVGAVLAQGSAIIGEGYHHSPGSPHAEVEALTNFERVPEDSVLYVNLEPCSHYGRTPPCTELLINKGVKKVIIATQDTAAHVNGQGIKQLREAGIEVAYGLYAEEARFINRRFFTYYELKRPYIILKWAETADGFMARKDGTSKWISGINARTLVHEWRAEESAILVGHNTLRNDNPSLTVRHVEGPHPLRIAISPSLKKKEDLSLFDGTSLTWVLTENPGEESDTVKYFSPQNGEDYLTLLLRLCRENQILSVFVEGGATTLNSFLERKLWDEIRVFRSRTVFFSSGIAAPKFSPSQVNVIESKEIEEDILDLIYSEHIQLKS